MADVTVNGVRLHHEYSGAEGAPWLVLSGSLLTDVRMWDGVVARLTPRYRVLRYEQRGHGRSELGPDPLTFELLADDCAALMATMGIDSATLIGSSMGGTTALMVAARHPALVTRVVVAGSRPSSAPDASAYWGRQMDTVHASGVEAIIPRTVQRWFTEPTVDDDGPSVRRAREMMRTTPARGYLAAAELLQSYDVRSSLSAVTCPVLLASGEDDAGARGSMEGTSTLLSDCRTTLIAGAGHLPPLEQPQRFVDAVIAFLQESERGRR